MAGAGNASGVSNDGPSNLVDEFESSFQACLSAFTNPSSNHIHDIEEVKTSVDQTIQRFLDNAKQMECFFLQKRLFLSVHKPEQMISEDINDIKAEIQRKDQVLARYHEKIAVWQSILNDQQPPQLSSQLPTGPSAQSMPGLPSQQQTPPNVQMQLSAGQLGNMPRGQLPPNMGMGGAGAPQNVGMRMGLQQQQQGGPGQSPMMVGPGHMGPGQMGQGPPQHMMGAPQGSPMMSPMGAAPHGSPMMVHQQQQQVVGPPQMSGHGQFMSPNSSGGPPQQQSNLQGPLAFLERTTSNIGMSEPRR